MKNVKSSIFEYLNNIRLWFLLKFRRSSFSNKRSNLQKDGWRLIFNDDFDSLDMSNWKDHNYYGLRFHPGSIEKNGVAPDEYQDSSCNVIENSILKQYCKKENTHIHYTDYDGKYWGEYDISYKTGFLSSIETYQYGYFETRSKMPNIISSWNAFWLTGQVTWPPEIDIYEWYGQRSGGHLTSTLHFGEDGKKTRGMLPWKIKLFDLADDFHVYGFAIVTVVGFVVFFIIFMFMTFMLVSCCLSVCSCVWVCGSRFAI